MTDKLWSKKWVLLTSDPSTYRIFFLSTRTVLPKFHVNYFEPASHNMFKLPLIPAQYLVPYPTIHLKPISIKEVSPFSKILLQGQWKLKISWCADENGKSIIFIRDSNKSVKNMTANDSYKTPPSVFISFTWTFPPLSAFSYIKGYFRFLWYEKQWVKEEKSLYTKASRFMISDYFVWRAQLALYQVLFFNEL